MRRSSATIGLLTALTAFACIHDDPVDPTTTTGDSDTGVPTTTAGECGDPGDCSDPITTCQTRTCIGGACGTAYLPKGSEWPSTFGDCRIDLCDGADGLETVLGDDPPPQVIGDCQRYVCDSGNAVTIVDESDIDNSADERQIAPPRANFRYRALSDRLKFGLVSARSWIDFFRGTEGDRHAHQRQDTRREAALDPLRNHV